MAAVPGSPFDVGGAANSVAIDASGDTAVFDEARSKRCDYVLFTDLTGAKPPKVKKGGMFGAAIGLGGGATSPGEASVAYRMFSIGNNEQAKLDSSKTNNTGNSMDETLGGAVQMEAAEVVQKIHELAGH